LGDADRAHIARLRERAIYGTPDVVAGRLRRLGAELGVEEVAILTTLHDPAARVRSYRLIAEAFGSGLAIAA
jgi:alkanesulfonate monooxygenase SsuD/methylene tetrahydromethanopterin reductase-like flavin-dependent oxidoreductase (luciferase family)